MYTVLLRLFGDTVGDRAVTNRVTMVQTAKKRHQMRGRCTSSICAQRCWTLSRANGGIRWDLFALDRVAYGCSARPEKCEKCDHFVGHCDPGSQPYRAPRPVLDSPRSFKHDSALSVRFSAGTAENGHLTACAHGGHGGSGYGGAARGEVGK
jgi:hypothetical protein